MWEMEVDLDYRNKVILAPMVRVNRLPFRELCGSHGVDICFSEELIDRKLITTTQRFNKELQCLEYVLNKEPKQVVYRYRCNPKVPTVLQIGTSGAELAVKTAIHMYKGYDGIDVNMGCPKRFSVQGGMGVALLRDQERVRDVMTALVRNIKKPVSCKIRIQRDLNKTRDLLKMLDGIGLANISIHSRYPDMRPNEPALPELIKPLVSGMSTTLTYNGDVLKREDFESLKEETGCSSVMVARGALYNCSIFSAQEAGLIEKDVVALDIMKGFLKYNLKFPLLKYVIQRMYEKEKKSNIFRGVTSSKTYVEVKKVFSHVRPMDSEEHISKKQKIDDEEEEEDGEV